MRSSNSSSRSSGSWGDPVNSDNNLAPLSWVIMLCGRGPLRQLLNQRPFQGCEARVYAFRSRFNVMVFVFGFMRLCWKWLHCVYSSFKGFFLFTYVEPITVFDIITLRRHENLWASSQSLFIWVAKQSVFWCCVGATGLTLWYNESSGRSTLSIQRHKPSCHQPTASNLNRSVDSPRPVSLSCERSYRIGRRSPLEATKCPICFNCTWNAPIYVSFVGHL